MQYIKTPIAKHSPAPGAAQVALVAIIILGIVLRLLYLVMNSGAPDFDAPVLDPQLNDYWARALYTGNWTPPPHADDPHLRTSPYGRPPAYPYLLAAVYTVSNGSYLAPRILQAMLGLLNVLLVYWLTRRMFGAVPALSAALLMSVYWAALYFEGELNSPTWEVFFALGMVCLLFCWEQQRRFMPLAAAGALLGVGALMRPNVLLTGCAPFIWFFWLAYRGEKHYGTALARCLVFGCACLVVVAPVLIRNWRVSGEFVLISYYGGINAYIGNNPEADGVSPTVPDLYEISGMDSWNCFNYPQVVDGLGNHLNKDDVSYADASRYFYGRAVLFWWEKPWQAIKLTLRKAWLFWGPHEISDSKVIHYERVHSALLSKLPGFPFMLGAALVGMVLAWRRRSTLSTQAVALVCLYIIFYFLSILPFFVAGRYRFPVAPFLLPFAGYALANTVEILRARQYKTGALLVLSLAITWGLASWPVLSYTPQLSTWYLHHGIAHAARDRMNAAEEAFLAAVEAKPHNDEARLQLGYLYARQGRSKEAMSQYDAAISVNPYNAYALNNLGFEYFRREGYDEALELYRRAVARHPAFTLAWNNLGNVLLELDRIKEAIDAYETVLDIRPDDPYGRYNMGNARLRQEHYDAAVEQYLLAFEITPTNPNIPNNLGLALARSDRLEASIQWFEKAIHLSPDHLLAHFNLGTVFADLGDRDKAQEHFERCLEIWPEHREAQVHLDQISRLAPG